MKIVYMGTPDFAVAPLHALLTSAHHVVGVVTVPDKPAGRGRQLQASAVKKYAEAHGLPLAQPVDLRDARFIAQLHAWNADVFVVVAFRLLPEEVFFLPPCGTFNLHASLLPQYRGAAPINRAIMNGETTTGVTTFFIDQHMDTGHIIFNTSTAIDADDNAGRLHNRLMHMGAALVVKTVDAIANGTAQTTAQPAAVNLKAAPKITKETRQIDWHHTPEEIHNQVRGLSPYPAATAELLQVPTNTPTQWKILVTAPEHTLHTFSPGTLVTDGLHTLKVACSGGFIHLKELQPAGKQAMTVDRFLAGFRHPEQYIFKSQQRCNGSEAVI